MTTLRRLFLCLPVLGCCVLAAPQAAQAQTPAKPRGQPADLLLLDGHIYTSSPARPWVRALAVRGEEIVAAGSDQEARKFQGPRTRTIELGGRMAMPGIIDSHSHFLEGSQTLDYVSLEGAYTVAEIERRVRAYAAAHPDRAWLRGRGWVYDTFKPSGLPTRQILDEIVPDRPVVLTCYDGHSVWVNSRALELARITRDTPDPKQGGLTVGFIVHDAQTGEPTGVLKEDPAMDLVYHAIPEPRHEENFTALRLGLKEANAHGVTSAFNADGTVAEMEFYDELDRRGELTVRMRTALLMETEITAKTLETYEAARRRFSSEWNHAGVIKAYMDGVVESHTAAMLEPYADDPKLSGSMNYRPEQFRKNVLELDRRGFQLITHAIGDRAIRTALDAYEAAEQSNGPRDRRFRIEHIENIHPADIPRFGRLHVIASMQPYHCYPEPNLLNVWARNVGPARLPYSFAWHDILAAGGRLNFGSDWPVVSLDPFIGIQNAVTRQDNSGQPAGGWLPHQKVTLEQTLAAYTRDAAYAEFEENVKGSLEPGKFADVIVLSQDLFAVNPLEIHKTTVMLTVVGGRIVHRAGL